jgi:phosphohistidine swiveling domain-containing protein
LQNARGIIKDEGGIISRAAIISRELDRPCTVRIGSVIQVLKDNEVIELNTEKESTILIE